MALNLTNLNSLARANGYSLWHYTTDDYSRDIKSGYFNRAHATLRPGDTIITTSENGDMPITTLFTVQAVGSASVRVRQMPDDEWEPAI